MTEYDLGGLQAYGPITLEEGASGRWKVRWSIEWEFIDALAAVHRAGELVAFEKASAGMYAVSVRVEPERTSIPKKPRARRKQ